MNKDQVVELIKKAFNTNGLELDSEVLSQGGNIAAFIPDSLTFISLVVTIEELFHIVLPDDLLQASAFTNGAVIVNRISAIVEENGQLQDDGRIL